MAKTSSARSERNPLKHLLLLGQAMRPSGVGPPSRPASGFGALPERRLRLARGPRCVLAAPRPWGKTRRTISSSSKDSRTLGSRHWVCAASRCGATCPHPLSGAGGGGGIHSAIRASADASYDSYAQQPAQSSRRAGGWPLAQCPPPPAPPPNPRPPNLNPPNLYQPNPCRLRKKVVLKTKEKLSTRQ